MVDDGVREMTVSFMDVGDEDPWREVDRWRRRHVCGGLTSYKSI